jgi:ABC-type transport system involved in multi-copper enzyme maturation permease subunit
LILEPALVRRELVVEVLRTKRAFFLVLLAVLFSIGMTLLAWPRHLQPAGMGMENVFSVVLFFETQLTAAILIIPAFTAGAIAGERERGTYELLHATLLSPRAIVFSKALASTGFVFILLAAAAPVACALYLVGGVAFPSFLQGYAVTLASVIQCGLICLNASKRSERTARAVIRGVAGIIFWNGGLFFLAFLVTGVLYGSRSGPPIWFPLLFSLSPHAATGATILGFGVFGRTSMPVEPWLGSVLYSMSISTLYLALVLLPSRVSETAESGDGSGRRTLRSRLKRRSLPTRLLLAIGERVPWNPVFLKEVRSEFFGRTIYRSLAFWGSLVLFIWIAAMNSRWEDAIYTVFTVATVLIVLIAPAVAASAFPREIEQGNIDFLRGTLLGFWAILAGKLLAAVYAVSGIVLAAGLACVPGFFEPGLSVHARRRP